MLVMNELLNYQHRALTSQDACHKTTTSFVEALHHKYVEQEEFENQFKLPKDRAISTEVTFVGFDQVASVQKQLKRLTSIDLSRCDIKTAGDVYAIRGCLDRVTVLNLADNYLTWQEVINILCCLPRLKEIVLTANNLQTNSGINYPEQRYGRLNSLVLGRTSLNWQGILEKISNIWSSIDHIDLWNSQLTNESLALSDEFLSHPFVANIKSLSLGQNRLTDMRWVAKAGKLNNLIELDVSRCQLKTLGIDQEIAEQLSNLRVLNISYNDITDWDEISRLNLLSNLTSLMCNDNPFYLTDKYARSQTTAKIASLSTLNREAITSAFRRDAEIMYLRRWLPEYEAFVEGKNANFRQMHPRYEELVELYGLPDGVQVKKRSIGDKFVTVELCYEDNKILKKVPRDMRVSNLKMLCKGLFKLKSPHGIEIICCATKSPQESIRYPLDQDGQTLHFFSVENNYSLLIKLSDS
jgi:hypothetical protein